MLTVFPVVCLLVMVALVVVFVVVVLLSILLFLVFSLRSSLDDCYIFVDGKAVEPPLSASPVFQEHHSI